MIHAAHETFTHPVEGIEPGGCSVSVDRGAVGNRAYSFEWAQDTFDVGQHLDLNDFKHLLTTVVFSGS